MKSGYEIARQWILAKQGKGGEVSDMSNINQTWSKFWKVRVPDRVKMIPWRIFHNSLPLFTNLLKKGCSLNTSCLFCGFKQEDFNHLFFDCWRSKCIWRSLGLENKFWQTTDQWNIDDIIWYIMTEEDSKMLRVITMVFWIIWFNRIQVAHGKTAVSINACCTKVNIYLTQLEKRYMAGFNNQTDCNSDNLETITFFCDGSWVSVVKNWRMGLDK